MSLKTLLLYSVFSLSIVLSISGKANNRPYLSWNSERVSADSISVKKLDSLLRPFVLEALADIHLETKEDAHNYSERLLVDAASILSKNQIDREEVLAALVSSLISQQIKEDFNLTDDFFYAILFQDQALYYAKLGFHKRALEIEMKAMDIILENKNDPDYDIYYPEELERLADRYHNLNDIERAIDYQELANEFYLSHSLLDYYCVSLYRSACYYFENEEHAKSIDYFNRFLVSREEIKEEVDLEDI